jgi:hypothetical protein
LTLTRVLAVAAVLIAGTGVAVWAAPDARPVTMTGCLDQTTGALSKLQVSHSTPLRRCTANEIRVQVSGGDITAVHTTANSGLVGGNDTGEVFPRLNFPLLDARYVNEQQAQPQVPLVVHVAFHQDAGPDGDTQTSDDTYTFVDIDDGSTLVTLTNGSSSNDLRVSACGAPRLLFPREFANGAQDVQLIDLGSGTVIETYARPSSDHVISSTSVAFSCHQHAALAGLPQLVANRALIVWFPRPGAPAPTYHAQLIDTDSGEIVGEWTDPEGEGHVLPNPFSCAGNRLVFGNRLVNSANGATVRELKVFFTPKLCEPVE